ncbi:MAG: cytochrome c3 family protein [Chloroflexota bacterium]
MATKNGKWLMAISGIVVITMFAWATVALGQPASQDWPPLQVSMSASARGNIIIYSTTIKNISSINVDDVFIAGSVPMDASFLYAASTPAGSWFRGFEGEGTELQAAVWLASRVPAGATAGPFTYMVSKGQAADLRAHGWIHFRLPLDGTAVSPDADPSLLPPLGMQMGERFHAIHVDRLALKCDSCHSATAASYADPLAQVSNPADKMACLACHQQGGVRPFFGEQWQQAR